MLTAADLEVNLLEFRRRSFQFDRLVELPSGTQAIFHRTETESERQLRPRLVRLAVVVPLAWVVHDEPSDTLRVAPAGRVPRSGESAAVEVAAEPSEFEEDGVRWKRAPTGPTGYVYVPEELADRLLSKEGLRELGLASERP